MVKKRRFVDEFGASNGRTEIETDVRSTVIEILTGIFCPSCHQELVIPSFAGNMALLEAVRLQSRALGAELQCRACGHVFVYRTTESTPPKPHLEQTGDLLTDIERALNESNASVDRQVDHETEV